MDCLGYCVIGGALIGSMLLILAGKNGAEDIAFKASLTAEQLDLYKDVYKQRLYTFLAGFGAGVVLSLIYAGAAVYAGARVNACIVIALVLGVATLYYLLAPKKTILSALTTQNQVALYANLNRAYSLRSTLGMVLGILGALIVGWGFSQ